MTQETPGIPQCPVCADTGHVCENHPDVPWDWAGLVPDALVPFCCAVRCGAGIPCPACCSAPPAGSSITLAFVPDRLRPRFDQP